MYRLFALFILGLSLRLRRQIHLPATFESRTLGWR
jgi:hypothetical protein